MKVSVGTVAVTDAQRRAINFSEGRDGLATRAEVRAWFVSSALARLTEKELLWAEDCEARRHE